MLDHSSGHSDCFKDGAEEELPLPHGLFTEACGGEHRGALVGGALLL